MAHVPCSFVTGITVNRERELARSLQLLVLVRKISSDEMATRDEKKTNTNQQQHQHQHREKRRNECTERAKSVVHVGNRKRPTEIVIYTRRNSENQELSKSSLN